MYYEHGTSPRKYDLDYDVKPKTRTKAKPKKTVKKAVKQKTALNRYGYIILGTILFFAFLVSLMVMTKIYSFINIISKNKFVSIIILFAFVTLNMVYRYFPFNFMSLFFYGDRWILNKIIWIGICCILDIGIYFNLSGTYK